MKNAKQLTIFLLMLMMLSVNVIAQSVTIGGTVINGATQNVVPAASVLVNNTGIGSYTDENGNFKITVENLPVVLKISHVNFATEEVTVSEALTNLQVILNPESTLGMDVVVSATRMPERILESPVSIERLNTMAIRNAAVPNYYEALINLKGVDLTTSSLLFRTVSTRGFNGSGNLRLNQLVDGMDNQAPALNFSVGNIIGVTELDVDNIEVLQGASSALYGSGGTNGTILINSKNPFQYQGLSVQVKTGVMHVDESQRSASPYYDFSLRWGKKVSEKFAFKLNAQYIKAQDWQAQDYRNLQRNNVFSNLKGGIEPSDPNYDGVSVFGDEASTSMTAFSTAAVAQIPQPGVAAIRGLAQLGLSPQQIVNALLSNSATSPLAPAVPFVLGLGTSPATNIFGGQSVSRTGYEEKHLVDYNTFNLKLNGGLFYKVSEQTEASIVGNWGTGTTVYTGADRYVLKNLIIGQYKAELRNPNWYLRAYTTQENSGDSYTATTAALYVNNAWKSNAAWFQQYTGVYGAARLGVLPNPSTPGTPYPSMNETQSHAVARAFADGGRYLPNSPEFKAAFNEAINTQINDGGAKFFDKSALYQAEGQYNLSEYTKVVDVLVGGNFRVYHINSEGTIFADTTGPINISEIGGYVQLQKKLLNDGLKLTGSIRYDKNENFDGRFTPRITALVRVAPNNNIRISYQTGYRFPTTQDQYINLLTGGANRLVGGLPQFETFFKFDQNPAYTAESIVRYRASFEAGSPDPTLLQQSKFPVIKPEISHSYELGYRGLLTSKLLLDAYTYYSNYTSFIGRIAVGRGSSNNAASAPVDLVSPYTTNNYSFVINTEDDVKAIGWGVSLNYQFGKGFEISTNVSSDKLQDVPDSVVTFFNTPKIRYNIGFSNVGIVKNFGFNVLYRWQDKVNWEGTFGTGPVPAYGVLDAQVNYRFPTYKSVIKLGASNLFNDYYYSAFGNPQVGGLYYVSVGYNIF